MAKKGFDVKVIAHKDKNHPSYQRKEIEFIEWPLKRGSKNIFAEIRSLWLLLKIIKFDIFIDEIQTSLAKILSGKVVIF